MSDGVNIGGIKLGLLVVNGLGYRFSEVFK